jgi:hypothetical protein
MEVEDTAPFGDHAQAESVIKNFQKSASRDCQFLFAAANKRCAARKKIISFAIK